MNLVRPITRLATSLATNGIVLLKKKRYIFIDQLDVAIFVNLVFFFSVMDGKFTLCEKILLDHGIDIFTCYDIGDVNSCAFTKHPSMYKVFALIVGQSLSGFVFEITWANFFMIKIHMLTNHVVGFMFVCFESLFT